MIYLLDLNYTLVDKGKDAPRIRPMELQIELETYRQWLIDMLKGKYVILTTARMQKYEIFTLNRIYTKTNWLPNESFFSIFRHLPHIKKEWILKWRIFPKHGNNPEQFFAIESNPKTRAMYTKYGIKSAPAIDDFGNRISIQDFDKIVCLYGRRK